MEEHPVIEREYMRVHEENKTEASKVWWIRWVRPDNVGGPARRCGSGRTRMGMDPDITSVGLEQLRKGMHVCTSLIVIAAVTHMSHCARNRHLYVRWVLMSCEATNLRSQVVIFLTLLHTTPLPWPLGVTSCNTHKTLLTHCMQSL